MSDVENIFTAKDGSGFVQFEEGKEVFPIGECWDTADLPDPQVDSEPVQCWDANRQPKTVGESTTMPGKITLTFTGLSQKAASYLEKIKEAKCRFTLFLSQTKCGKKDIITNWERAYTFRKCRVVDNPIANAMMRESDDPTTSAFNITAWPGRIDHRLPVVTRISTTETAALNAIAGNSIDCGCYGSEHRPLCQDLVAAADTVAAAIPDVLVSADRGATWTSPATTFAAAESVICIAWMQIDKNTVRWFGVRDADAANPLEGWYTDDGAATATLPVIGATNNEAPTGGPALHVLDESHAWLVTDTGRVFVSTDGCASWTEQTTGLSASGGAALNAVHFANANIGYAVGDGDVIIVTTDGGTNWAAATATGTGDDLYTVHTFNEQRVIVGTDAAGGAGGLYMTYDGTTSWSRITHLDTTAAEAVNHVRFLADDLTGYLVSNVGGLGSVHHTIDGGWSWTKLSTPTNSGLNYIHVCNPNLAFVVGETNAATSMILQVEG